MTVEKKKVTEVREVEVEKVVLTLSMEQAEFITALLRNTTYRSLSLVKGMECVMEGLKGVVDDFARKFSTDHIISVERRPYARGGAPENGG